MVLGKYCEVVLFRFWRKEGLPEKIGRGYHFINDPNPSTTKSLYFIV